MGHDGGCFRRTIGQRQQAARNVEIAGGQREGVDGGRIQNGDAIGCPRSFSGNFLRLRKPRQQIVEERFSGGRAILAAKHRDKFFMLGTVVGCARGRRRKRLAKQSGWASQIKADAGGQ